MIQNIYVEIFYRKEIQIKTTTTVMVCRIRNV